MLNVASNEEGEWSSVGPSPRNLPPVALLGQKGYHVDSVVIAAPDVDVEVFLAGLDSNMSPIASTTAPHGIVSTTFIDPFDTTMGGGGFHPVEMNVTEQQGFLPSASASSSILFPDTVLDESEIKPTPIDEQLVAYEDGTLLEEIQAETGMVKTAESEMAAELDGDDDSRRDVYGVMQCWIMTVKDHSTGLTYITSLPRKRASFVAFELSKLFGFIGYPAIFHTDNGKEFTALEILNVLRTMSSSIITVTGRPRTPRDQGSVESMNKLVKRALMNIISERRTLGGDANPKSKLDTPVRQCYGCC